MQSPRLNGAEIIVNALNLPASHRQVTLTRRTVSGARTVSFLAEQPACAQSAATVAPTWHVRIRSSPGRAASAEFVTASATVRGMVPMQGIVPNKPVIGSCSMNQKKSTAEPDDPCGRVRAVLAARKPSSSAGCMCFQILPHYSCDTSTAPKARKTTRAAAMRVYKVAHQRDESLSS